MNEKNETVVVDLDFADRMRLQEQILAAMQEEGFKAFDYDALDLGFHLPASWPADKDCEVTLGQLTVLAVKLEMQITISNLDMNKMQE